MARNYSPKNFLRQAPNALLARYCQEKGILAEPYFAGLFETNITPIFEAFAKLPSETRRMMESDFRNIDALAGESGIKAIMDVARDQGEDLDSLKRRDFSFIYDPDSGITGVVIKKLRLSTLGGAMKRVTLEADASQNPDAVYNLLEEVVRVDGAPECHQCHKIPLSLVNVTQAAIQVVFNHNGDRRRATRTFQVSYPNSCSLKQDGRDLVIRKMLVDSGLEPVEAVDEEFRLQ